MSERYDISRRAFVAGALGSLAFAPRLLAGHHEAGEKPAGTSAVSDAASAALAVSPYVYVSPLQRDGSESHCHGEIWFAWLDGEVVSSTATDRWKARAIRTGRTRARIWVGDHGRWKNGSNEAFRKAPSFLAEGRTAADPALLERILEVYAEKYPREIDRWAGRMRKELASGKRVLLRYRPVAS